MSAVTGHSQGIINPAGVIEVENRGGGDCLFYAYSTFLLYECQKALAIPDADCSAEDRRIIDLVTKDYGITEQKINAFQIGANVSGIASGRRNPEDDALLKRMATKTRARLIVMKQEEICAVLVGDKDHKDSSYFRDSVLPVKAFLEDVKRSSENSVSRAIRERWRVRSAVEDSVTMSDFRADAKQILETLPSTEVTLEEREQAKKDILGELKLEEAWENTVTGIQAAYLERGQVADASIQRALCSLEEPSSIFKIMQALDSKSSNQANRALCLQTLGLEEKDGQQIVLGNQIYESAFKGKNLEEFKDGPLKAAMVSLAQDHKQWSEYADKVYQYAWAHGNLTGFAEAAPVGRGGPEEKVKQTMLALAQKHQQEAKSQDLEEHVKESRRTNEPKQARQEGQGIEVLQIALEVLGKPKLSEAASINRGKDFDRVNDAVSIWVKKKRDEAPDQGFFLGTLGLNQSEANLIQYAKKYYAAISLDPPGPPPSEKGLTGEQKEQVAAIKLEMEELFAGGKSVDNITIVQAALAIMKKPPLSESAVGRLIAHKSKMDRLDQSTWGTQTDIDLLLARDGFKSASTQLIVPKSETRDQQIVDRSGKRVFYLTNIKGKVADHWRVGFDIFAKSKYPMNSPHVAKLASKYAKHVPLKAESIETLGFDEIKAVLYLSSREEAKLNAAGSSELGFRSQITILLATLKDSKDVAAFMGALKAELVAQVKSGKLDLSKSSELRDQLDYLFMRSEGRTAKDAYAHQTSLVAGAPKLTFADINASLIAYRHGERQAAKKTPLSWIRSSHPFDERLVSILLQISNDCQQKSGSVPSVKDFMKQLENVLIAQLKSGKINLEKDPALRNCINDLFKKHSGKKFTELYDNEGNAKAQQEQKSEAVQTVAPIVEAKGPEGPAVLGR